MNVPFLDLQAVNRSFGQPLIEVATRTIQSGRYLHGYETEAFEAEWAAFCGVSHAVGVGNGLDALRLTLMAWKIMYGWHDGDEVLVPANTFIATPLAVSQAGLRPVFCDVNPTDALICTKPEYLDGLLTSRTRCIIPVHLYGRLADLTAIFSFAQRHDLKVLEDACQAHGARSTHDARKRTCAWSFYPGKNLGALGDGGCVTTCDADLADLIRSLANYGQTSKYFHEQKGINSRLDELQAAILRVKLHRLDSDNRRRQQIAAHYASELAGLQHQAILDGSHVYHIYPHRCVRRTLLQEYLSAAGIGTLIHYPVPCHQQKAYHTHCVPTLPVAEAWCAQELSLPISPVLTDEQVQYVATKVLQFYDKFADLLTMS